MDGQRPRSDDPFLRNYQPSELKIASEFFSTWLPFLSKDLCRQCSLKLSNRIRSIDPELHGDVKREGFDDGRDDSVHERCDDHDDNHGDVKREGFDDGRDDSVHERCDDHDDNCDANSLGSWKDGAEASYSGEPSGWSEPVSEVSVGEGSYESLLLETPSPRMSWADMAQEDEFGEEEESEKLMVKGGSSDGAMSRVAEKPKLPWAQREKLRFHSVRRKKDYMCFERVNGKLVNILEGLELHTSVFSAAEQNRIVDYVSELQEMGRKGQLKARTYTAPQKWMRGKGRQTIQFGCCYNYATDKDGNPPGILQNEMVDPIPHLFKVIIRRLIRWHVLPPTCVPDSCIVNIYEEGDCIPPHIDNHDFVRPFCTVSFLSECNIVFGSNLKAVGPGEFDGSVAIPLPVGSVLVLNGNGADVAKHCVPAVSAKRISITFRRMDASKRPIGYVPEPDLQGVQPVVFEGKRSNGSRDNRDVRDKRYNWNQNQNQNQNYRGRRNDGKGPATGRDRNSEPYESTQSAQRPSYRQGRGRMGG